MADAPRAEVLGKLLILQHGLDTMLDAARMGAFLRRALTEVPGVADAALRLDLPGEPPAAALWIAEQPGVWSLELRTVRRSFGALTLTIADPVAFAPYAPLLHNVANMVALTLETRDHIGQIEEANRALRRAKEGLEEQVAQRTAELLAGEQRYRLTFERAPVGIAHLGLDLRLLRVNPRYCEILGYTEGELAGELVTALIHPDDQGADAELRRALLSGEQGYYVTQRRYVRKDGAVIWGQSTVALQPGEGSAAGYFVAVVEDITARREAEEKLRLVSEKTPLGVVIVQDRRFCYANQAVAEMCGYTVAEIVGARVDLRRFVHPEDLTATMQAYDRITSAPDEVTQFSYRMLTKSGEARWIDQRFRSVQHLGRPSFLATLVDTTERKRAEEALAEKTRRYELLLRTSRDAIHVIDAQGRLREHTPAFLELLGYSPEEVGSLHVWDWDAAGPRESATRNVSQPGRFDTVFRRKDGTLREVELEAAPMVVGDEVLFYGSARDVTERNRAAQELRQLWRAVEEAPVSIVITNLDGDIEYTNPAFSRITGYPAQEVRGKNPRLFQSGETPKDVYEAMWATILSGREWRGEFVNRKKSGELYVEDARIAPVLDATGAVAHFVGVKADITAEKEAQRQLTTLNAELERRVAERTGELERASRAKDEFLAAMSHELRTPLNGVLGISEALQVGVYGPLNDRQQRALGRVEESGRHLLAVLSDILDVSMLAAGALAVTLDPLDVSKVCVASLRIVEESARRKRQRLTIDLGEDGVEARADARRLTQMLVNLLDNAVKFTAEGGAVSVRVTASASTIRVAVRDSGIGIAAEKIPLLFQRFVQLDATLARRHGGSGLGLALTQRLAELHGGRVEVESTPGVGSCFTLVLPRL